MLFLCSRPNSPPLVLDSLKVWGPYQELWQALPGVERHYAEKGQPFPGILRCLAHMGCNFDLASSGEIRLIQDLPVPARGTIHTRAAKRDDDIRTALRYGCTTFVVDHTLAPAIFPHQPNSHFGF